MSKFVLPTSDETSIELSWKDSDIKVTIDIVDLDILHDQVEKATKDNPENLYPLLIDELNKTYGISLTKGQAWSLLQMKVKMFEVLKKSFLA
jgi:hypothetical protein